MFAVSRFKNRNGVFSFRVDGHLNGVRIRRNFKTQEEAAALKATLELKALQMKSSLRAVTTCLAEDQVREFETLRFSVRGNVSQVKSNVATLRKSLPQNRRFLGDRLRLRSNSASQKCG